MSGPKVVRIVTREEVLSICAGLLARVEAALADWVRIGSRNDCISEGEIIASRARVDALRALMATDRFLDVQKRAPQEVVSLQEDMQARLMRKTDDASARRLMDRRRIEATATLLKTLTARGKSVPSELQARLSSVDIDVATRAMTEAFGLLADLPEGASDEKRALAVRLKDEVRSTSLADWLETQPAGAGEAGLQRLERQISELVTLGSETMAVFEIRIQQARNELGPRRELLIDSIQLDLSRELNRQKEKARLDLDIAMALAELKSLGTEDAVMSRSPSTSITDCQAQLVAIQADIQARRGQKAAHARRAAVLKSLASLGYEVTEGLQTAWVANGKVVVRKAAPPGYGVELTGTPDLARMQMRVVAFEGEAPVDAVRDRDAETLWCGDIAELERNLAREGGALLIDRAMPVGAVAVKRVGGRTSVNAQGSVEGRPAQSRTLG